MHSAAIQSKITQLPLKDKGKNREVVGFQLATDSHLDLTFCCLMFEAAPCVGNGSVICFGQVHTSLGEARKMSQPGHPGILLNPHFRLLSSPLALCSCLFLQWVIPAKSADKSFTQAFFKSEHQIRDGFTIWGLPLSAQTDLESCKSCLSALLWGLSQIPRVH